MFFLQTWQIIFNLLTEAVFPVFDSEGSSHYQTEMEYLEISLFPVSLSESSCWHLDTVNKQR